MTIVFKVSEKVQQKMISYYEDKRREKTPPYAIFQALDADTIVTLYESGKVMFQGVSADIDANMWVETEKKLTGLTINMNEMKERKEKTTIARKTIYGLTTIGSDEVGTGDYFGPIVVTASYVPKEQIEFLDRLGVKDSKKLTDEKIMEIAPTLIKEVDHCTFILKNDEYNKYQNNGYNMNKIKAILHNKVLFKVKSEHPQYDKIIIDQFVFPKKYFEHIQEAKDKVKDITFLTKAENLCASVAVSSCISRYIFLKEIDKLSEELGITVLKGSGEEVDKLTAEIVKKYGDEKLYHIAKLNFKNTEKYKQYM